MTILVARNGKKIDTSQFENKGYGVFTEYVRQNIDSKWGRTEDEENAYRPTVYNIKFKAVKTVPCYADLEIEADTRQEAEEKAKREIWRKKDWINWDDGVNEEIEDIEIDDIEELENDEITIKQDKRNDDPVLVFV